MKVLSGRPVLCQLLCLGAQLILQPLHQVDDILVGAVIPDELKLFLDSLLSEQGLGQHPPQLLHLGTLRLFRCLPILELSLQRPDDLAQLADLLHGGLQLLLLIGGAHSRVNLILILAILTHLLVKTNTLFPSSAKVEFNLF